jgi:hypothetical protein
MKNDLIALVASLASIAGLVYLFQTAAADMSGHGRYYLTTALLISMALAVIFLVRLVSRKPQRDDSVYPAAETMDDRQRQHYRLQFDLTQRPMFIQKSAPDQTGVAFTCPVNDISETGICLDCVGVYPPGKAIQGEIIFNSGRSAPVNGVVVREEIDRTSLKLHCTISPPLLMAEQRSLIAAQKGHGPPPAVDRQLLNVGGSGLPSHSPKGICRNKRR